MIITLPAFHTEAFSLRMANPVNGHSSQVALHQSF